MQETHQKSVRIVSIIIMIISAFATISNIGGAIMSEVIELGMPYYLVICMVSGSIGIIYFIGSYSMLKHKSWARKFLLNVSILIVTLALLYPIFAFALLSWENDNFIVKIGSIAAFFFYGIPLSFLIKYLGSEKVKKHFESKK